MPARLPWQPQHPRQPQRRGFGPSLLRRSESLRSAVNLTLGIGQSGRLCQRGGNQLAGWQPRPLPTLHEVFPEEFPDPAAPSQSSTTGVPGTSPAGECEWQSRFHELELEQSRREDEERCRHQQQFESAESAARRSAAELALSRALGEEEVSSPKQSHQRAMMLRPAVREAREALQASGAPPGATGGLTRMIKLADTWLERWMAHEEKKQGVSDYADRVRRGEASDWDMTQQGLEERVISGDLGGVRAGIRAKLSVLRRCKEQRSRTLIHLACDQLGLQQVSNSHRFSSAYIKIVDALLKAGASANSVDDDGLSPLDLALPGASPEVQDALHKFGLRQRLGPRMQAQHIAPAPPAVEPAEEPVAELIDNWTRSNWKDVMTSGSEWRREGTFFDGDETKDPLNESKPGPLAQFLATGALLRSSGGWYKPPPGGSTGLSNSGFQGSMGLSNSGLK